jgi:heme A synthase
VGLLLSPLVAFAPFRYWVFHHAGGWFVATDLEPEHRAVHLGEMFLLVLVSFSAVAVFLGLLLLYSDGYRRRLIGWLLVPSMLAAIPGILVLASLMVFYLRFSGGHG